MHSSIIRNVFYGIYSYMYFLQICELEIEFECDKGTGLSVSKYYNFRNLICKGKVD